MAAQIREIWVRLHPDRAVVAFDELWLAVNEQPEPTQRLLDAMLAMRKTICNEPFNRVTPEQSRQTLDPPPCLPSRL